jgi:rSAM/selenodomain-associated transferase 2/rSAM/selenodomain-associated transferase 1
MRHDARISVVIPALNEEPSIGRVIAAIPPWVDEIVVADNGSTDGTAEVAREHGARTVSELRRGYGAACLAGISDLRDPDVVVFLDGDFSDHPEEMPDLVDPIATGEVDLVIGSRVLGRCEAGALTPQQRFGNGLACALIRFFWRTPYTDLGPFRAIGSRALQRLRMADRDYGWTVEMQIKAAALGLRVREVPVRYRRRIGTSKISGTLRGVVGAGTKILSTILRAALGARRTAGSGAHGAAGPDDHGAAVSDFQEAAGPDDHGASAPGYPPGVRIRPKEIEKRVYCERLLVFTRYPEPGRTKTRLIPALGERGAADLQRRMTEHTLARVRRFTRGRPGLVEVVYEGGDARLMGTWLGPDLVYRPQGKGHLGARMARVFRASFRDGTERAVIIGIDCPNLTADILDRAFRALRGRDLVLGPARDGGYYLIGLRRDASGRAIPSLFTGISWGTGAVLSETLEVAEKRGLTRELLDPLADVDRPEDLPLWDRVRLAHQGSERMPGGEPGWERKIRPRISVIIPALDEREYIARALESAIRARDVEVLVIDGGSRDGTVELARSRGVRVISERPGRARQMNAGAAEATGDILLFLHADTRLPKGYDARVRRILARPGTAAGAFSLRFDASSRGLKWIERLANWRSRWLGLPFGDQAIFVRADLFHRLGGYREMPIMEDFELMRRLRLRGRIAMASKPAVTSARRWLARGTWWTTLIHQAIIGAYALGVSPARIARWFRRG